MFSPFLPAPDPPNFLSQYLMVEGSDFAQQTRAINSIDDVLITQETRTVCYNQPIYDDLRLEQHEYIGLTLGVGFSTTSLTLVDQTNNHASILILDNDSRFGTYLLYFHPKHYTFYSQEVW